MTNSTNYIGSDGEPDNENVLENELQRFGRLRTRQPFLINIHSLGQALRIQYSDCEKENDEFKNLGMDEPGVASHVNTQQAPSTAAEQMTLASGQSLWKRKTKLRSCFRSSGPLVRYFIVSTNTLKPLSIPPDVLEEIGKSPGRASRRRP